MIKTAPAKRNHGWPWSPWYWNTMMVTLPWPRNHGLPWSAYHGHNVNSGNHGQPWLNHDLKKPELRCPVSSGETISGPSKRWSCTKIQSHKQWAHTWTTHWKRPVKQIINFLNNQAKERPNHCEHHQGPLLTGDKVPFSSNKLPVDIHCTAPHRTITLPPDNFSTCLCLASSKNRHCQLHHANTTGFIPWDTH